MEFDYKRTTAIPELEQILELQQKNLPSNISRAEKEAEGFLTVTHELELLSRMHKKCPHIIAKSGSTIVGYALCMHPVFANEIVVLRSMFERIEKLLPKNLGFMVMGQICVDKPFRKKGVFRGLYHSMRTALKDDCSLIITEVDEENVRSLNAHYALGFTKLEVYTSKGRKWHLIQWKL